MSTNNAFAAARLQRAVGLALVIGLVAGVLADSAARSAPAAANTKAPNIVVIMTDDQTVESLRYMSQLRQHLATKGTEFTNSFVSYPLCCPSRATFLSGQYSHNNGVTFNSGDNGGWDATRKFAPTAVPSALQSAGYHTAHFGKVTNKYGEDDPAEVPPGWSQWHAMVDFPAKNRYYGFRVNVNGRVSKVPVTGMNHNTDYFSRQAQAYIRSRAGTRNPFFLNLWLFAPHGEPEPGTGSGPTIPAARHVGDLAHLPLPAPPSLNEQDMSDKPAHLQRPPLSAAELAKAQRLYRWRLETMLSVDEAVGDLMDTLAETRQLANTLVVFTSDNGYFHGEHRIRSGKWHVYDEAARVPLIMRGPGVPVGRVGENVSNIDLGPTLLDYAGVTPLMQPDGLSLRPLIERRQQTFGRDLLFTTGFATAKRWYTAIRTQQPLESGSGQYLYVEHVQDADGEDIIGEELYDLGADPHQLNSRHEDPAYAAIRDELRDKLYRLRVCAGPTCQSRQNLPPADDGGEVVPPEEVITEGPIDDPEQYPEFFDEEPEPEPAPNPNRKAAAVTLSVDNASVTGTESRTFTARATVEGVPAAGAEVLLQFRMRDTNPWLEANSARTGADGTARFVNEQFANATWRARVKATETHTKAVSPQVDVSVAPRVATTLSEKVVRAGRKVTITGLVEPYRRNQLVTLEARTGGSWMTVGETRLDRDSRYSFAVDAAPRVVEYRVRKPTTKTLKGGTGPTRKLKGYAMKITRFQPNAPGNDSRNLNGEFVVVRNRGEQKVGLRRWMLHSVARGTSYVLPRYSLAPGERVRIHSGSAKRRPGHLYLRSKRPLWINRGDTAQLFHPRGIRMAQRRD